MSILSAFASSSSVDLKQEAFDQMIENDLNQQMSVVESSVKNTLDHNKKIKLFSFFKNIKTAKKAYQEFSKSNPKTVAQYYDFLNNNQISKENFENYVENAKNKLSFGLAKACKLEHEYWSPLPDNIHLFIFGWAQYNDCGNDKNGIVTYLTLGPGLEAVFNIGIGLICAINNVKPNGKASYNVGVRGSATLGVGAHAAIAVGENGICISAGYNTGIGANAGITLLMIDQ